MNIKSLYPTSSAPARRDIPAAQRESNPPEESSRPQLRIVRDKVVISYRARALLNEMRQMPEVNMSIKTLLGTPPLTEERASEVIDRIHHGFYNQPEVLREVASVLSTALKTNP